MEYLSVTMTTRSEWYVQYAAVRTSVLARPALD